MDVIPAVGVMSAHGTRLLLPNPPGADLVHGDGNLAPARLLRVAVPLSLPGKARFRPISPVRIAGYGGTEWYESVTAVTGENGTIAFQNDAGNFLTAGPPDPVSRAGSCGFFAQEIGPWELFRTVVEADLRPEERSSVLPDLVALDRAFAAKLAACLVPPEPVPFALPRYVGKELDELGGVDTFRSPMRTLLKHALGRRIPTQSLAVVTSVKNEGPYIIEWLAHCWAVGFAHVYVYTNDNSDGSDTLLARLHEARALVLIYNDTGPTVSPQRKAYEHSLSMLPELYDAEWVAYFDCDEFVIPSAAHNHSLISVMDQLKAAPDHLRVSALCLNWDWYGSNHAIHRAEGLVQERFLFSRPHDHIKSIVRVRDVATMGEFHLPTLVDGVFVNGDLTPVKATGASLLPVAMQHAKLNHYYQKSWEEFGCKRYRGEGSAPGGLTGKALSTFFDWNVTSENGAYAPTPPALLRKVKDRAQWLRSLPGIDEAERKTLSRHRAIAAEVFSNGIEEAYLLNRPPQMPLV